MMVLKFWAEWRGYIPEYHPLGYALVPNDFLIIFSLNRKKVIKEKNVEESMANNFFYTLLFILIKKHDKNDHFSQNCHQLNVVHFYHVFC